MTKSSHRPRILLRTTLDDMSRGERWGRHYRQPATLRQLIALRDMRMRELARATARLAGI